MIYQLSPPRCGSTLMWQCLNEIYKGEVVKSHGEKINAPAKVFCSVRDFRDSFLSYMRVNEVNIKNINKTLIDKYFPHYKRKIEIFNKVYSKLDNKYLLKYEDFYSNFEILFDFIAKGLDKKISENLRITLSKKYSFKSNMQVSKKFTTFKGKFDKATKIHGKHLHKGSVGGWKNYIPKHLHEYYSKLFNKYLKMYGYTD